MADENLTPRDHLLMLRRPLLGPDGLDLLNYLEAVFCERRQVVTDQTASGPMQRIARMTSFDDNPYRTAYNEGCRSVVLFLKDLREMEG